jgi:hypothetical protein
VKLENGNWKLENGNWKLETEEWKVRPVGFQFLFSDSGRE